MNYLFSIALAFTLASCLSSPDPEASYPLTVQEDKPYFEVYSRVSRSLDVINNFETKIQIGLSQLTPEFRQAAAVRYEHIFHEPQPSLNEVGDKTGFFISLYTANRVLGDLNDKELWNVTLEVAGKKLEPAHIQKLGPKERWSPFFPSINPWSHDYLVLFDLVQGEAGTAASSILTLSSPEGSVTTKW